MKFYSEKLNQLFDSEEELIAAESTKSKKKKVAVTEKVVEPAHTEPEAPTRKQLAAAVENADNAVKEAYANYEAAKTKVEELSKKYLEEVNSIIEPAKKAVKDAEKSRYEAIRNFNDSYGAYQVTYTGARAADEMINAINNINANTYNIFKDIFWI